MIAMNNIKVLQFVLPHPSKNKQEMTTKNINHVTHPSPFHFIFLLQLANSCKSCCLWN